MIHTVIHYVIRQAVPLNKGKPFRTPTLASHRLYATGAGTALDNTTFTQNMRFQIGKSSRFTSR